MADNNSGRCLTLEDMYPHIIGFVDGFSAPSHDGKLSEILSQELSRHYKGLLCMCNQMDYEHHHKQFMSEIEKVSVDIGPDGFRVYVKVKDEVKSIDRADDYDAFYGVINNTIHEGDFERLLAKNPQKLEEPHTWTHKRGTELVPEKVRDRQGNLSYNIFLVRDSRLVKAN